MKRMHIRRSLSRPALRELLDKHWRAYELAALHEAGHVLVGYALGLDVFFVKLGPGEQGRVEFAGPIRDGDKLFRHFKPIPLVEQVAVDLAGFFAERLEYPELRDWASDGVRGDIERVRRALGTLPASERFGVMLRASRLARRILIRHWGAVESVAGLLESKRAPPPDDFGCLMWPEVREELKPLLRDFRVPNGRRGITQKEPLNLKRMPSADGATTPPNPFAIDHPVDFYTLQERWKPHLAAGLSPSRSEVARAVSIIGRVPAPRLLACLLWTKRLTAEAATLAGEVWSECEFPNEALPMRDWRQIFDLAGFCVDGVPAERPTEPLTLYRGATESRRRLWSWTDDLKVAQKFTQNPTRGPGSVWRAVVRPNRLLARQTGRSESEWVVDTRGLKIEAVC